MYPPPQDIETSFYTRVPAELRKTAITKERLAAGRGAPKAGANLGGPAFDRAGNLYLVDNCYGRIFRADPGGRVEAMAEYDGEPNGLRIHRDGRIFVADTKQGIVLFDPDDGSITPVVSRYNTGHFLGVNDLIFSRNGDLWFTDPGQSDLRDPIGRVFRLRTTGEVLLVADKLPGPTGLVFNGAEDTLYVAVAGANAIWRLPLTPGGTVARMGLAQQLAGGTGPAGIAMTEDGGLAVAQPGTGSVWIFDRHGAPIYRVYSCAGDNVTNITWGGTGCRTLYITENDSGAVLMAQMPLAGRVPYSHT